MCAARVTTKALTAHNKTNEGGNARRAYIKSPLQIYRKNNKKKHISKTPFAINDDNWSNVAPTTQRKNVQNTRAENVKRGEKYETRMEKNTMETAK